MTIKFGLSINLNDPAIIEMAGWIGYNFVWIDCEHTLFSNIGELVRASEVVGMEAWIRVPQNDPTTIGQFLNTGARAVIVPHVRSHGDAERAVRSAKLQPVGQRNWFSKARDGRYGLIPARNYPEFRNPTTRLVVQVEDPEGVEAIDEILDTPGVDMVMTGPGDLAHSLGIAGQFDDPRIVAAEERIFTAADRRHIPVLHFADTAAELESLQRHHPVTHLVVASDAAIMSRALRDQFDRLATTQRQR